MIIHIWLSHYLLQFVTVNDPVSYTHLNTPSAVSLCYCDFQREKGENGLSVATFVKCADKLLSNQEQCFLFSLLTLFFILGRKTFGVNRR